jgi:hypothetical protein
VNAHIASRLGLATRWLREDDGHIRSTTALVVLDDCAGRLARSCLLAHGLIRKGIMKLEVAVELDGNLKLGDGESVKCAGGHLRAAGLVLGRLGSDALSIEGSWEKLVTLAAAERVLAGEALEVESSVISDWSNREIAPVESTILLWNTDFRGVDWTWER